jgi:mannosyltransferase OCH1-like enzyme
MNIIQDIPNEELIKITIPEYITVKEREMQTNFLLNEFNLSQEEANKNMHLLREKAINLIELNLPNEEFIRITHKIWLTDINKPYEPNETTQNLVKNQYIILHEHDYTHFFWTNYPNFCKQFISKWNIDCTNIQIRDVSEFENYYGYNFYNAYMNQNFFANACDILKLQVVCKYGGIYSDMGFSIKPTIYNIIKNFNIVINGEFYDIGIVSHNILGSKVRENYFYKTILEKIDNLDIIKKYCTSKKNIFEIAKEFAGPRMLTAAISSLCKNDKVLLIVNNEFTCERYHNHSWFGEKSKYGCNLHKNIDLIKFKNDLQR